MQNNTTYTTNNANKTYTYFNPDEDIVKVDRQEATTTGIFSSGNGTVSSIYTSSVQWEASSSHYYLHGYDLVTTASVSFDMAYGNAASSNALTYVTSSYEELYKPDQAIYSQYANICLPANETMFTFADGGTGSGEILVINFNRSNLKDGIDPGNWELQLNDGINTIKLIDNYNRASTPVPSTGPNVGAAYYITSGSGLGSDAVYESALDENSAYGIIYPTLGIIILNANKLNTSMNNLAFSTTSAKDNIQKFYNLINSGNYFAGRNTEKLSTTHYYCRLKNKKYNYSNNPTWLTGSNNVMKYSEMYNNPKVYVTTIGLYSDTGDLLAVAKLNKPQLKDFEREMLIAVRISY